MNRQTPLAFVFGVLLVTSAALSGAPVPSPVGDAEADSHTCQVGPLTVVRGTGILDLCPAPDTDDLEQADALETKQEIYTQGSTQRQNNENILTSYKNYLQDTPTIARMEGKNAYIRALNNGSSEAEARTAARTAVSGYYAVKQVNLLASWNTTMEVVNSSEFAVDNTTGISSDFIYPYHDNQTLSSDNYDMSGQLVSVTLVNSSTENVKSLRLRTNDLGIVGWAEGDFHPAGRARTNGDWSSGGASTSGRAGVKVKPPNSNYDTMQLVSAKEYNDVWTEIEAQNTQVQNELDTFIDSTYEEYQAGAINDSDLVDPYLGAREYAPENGTNFDAYTLRSLASLGLDTPENLSNIGRMNVSNNGLTYTGIVMADSTPDGGFAVGETYNASNLTGHEFVALDNGGTHTLEGEFTLTSAETASGETVAVNESITYNNVTYETTNTSEYQALQEDLRNLTAQINDRQQRLRSGAGAGGVNLGGNAPVIVAVGLLAILALKEES